MGNFVYNYYKKATMVGSFNFNAVQGTMYFMLVGSGYSPNIDTDIYRSAVTNEIAGTYTAGGYVMSSPQVLIDTGNNQGVLDASDIAIYNVTYGTIPYYAVLYLSTPQGATSDPLICAVDLVTYNAVTSGTFQIQWASGGILALT